MAPLIQRFSRLRFGALPCAARLHIAASRDFIARVTLLLITLLGPVRATAGEMELQEPAVKAAGLFKIISFVEWPAEAFSTPDAPLVVGVLGHGPVADLLPAFGENETWNGRRVVVRQLSSAGAGLDCHVLFIGRSEHGDWTFLRQQFARRPILTVSDAGQFARAGGVVQLSTARNRLHLIINLSAARAAGVTISSKVLRLAEVIGEGRP